MGRADITSVPGDVVGTWHALLPVRDTHKQLVPGNRTLSVLAVTPKRRGLLSQNVWSREEPGLVSEAGEGHSLRATVHEALVAGHVESQVTGFQESGCDDVAVWRTMWEQREHVVCRVCQRPRLVEWPTESGASRRGPREEAARRRKTRAMGQTKRDVPIGKQRHPKQQEVHVDLSACSFPLPSDSAVRRPTRGSKPILHQTLWLVQVRVLGSPWEPWWRLTDGPVATEAEAMRIVRLDRRRWGVEERFPFPKTCLAWDEVHVLDGQAIKTVVALAWVAAGVLSEMGVTFSWEDVPVRSKRGGWVPHRGRFPGTIVW